MKETKHDYQNCLVGNYYDRDCTGNFNNWNNFKEEFAAFRKDGSFDDTYHFVFRYDIYKKNDGIYKLELCIMLQRKGIYIHIYIENINQKELDGEIKEWLKNRKLYLSKLWEEV